MKKIKSEAQRKLENVMEQRDKLLSAAILSLAILEGNVSKIDVIRRYIKLIKRAVDFTLAKHVQKAK